jgi:hypothetical protein
MGVAAFVGVGCRTILEAPTNIKTRILVRYPVDPLTGQPVADDVRHVEEILTRHAGAFERKAYEGTDTFAYTIVAKEPETLVLVHHDLVQLRKDESHSVPIYYQNAAASLDYRGTPLAGFVRTRVVFTVEPVATLELIYPNRRVKEDVSGRLDKKGNPWVLDEIVAVHPSDKFVLARSIKGSAISYVKLGLFDLESTRISAAEWTRAEQDVVHNR